MDTMHGRSAENFRIGGNWNTQSKNLKAKFPQLTDKDLEFETGKEDDLLERLGNRLGKTHEEVIGIIRKSRLENV